MAAVEAHRIPEGPADAPAKRLGFETLDEEVRVRGLPVRGEFPSWLRGTLVRVTPALFEIGGKPVAHWFDALAMLNAFSFEGGRVSYASRFLESRAYKAARDGRVDYMGVLNDPCRSYFRRVVGLFDPVITDNCNVNLAKLGNRYLAYTETPLPIEFDLDTLETRGLVRWKDRVGGRAFSAHPHYDPRRGEQVSYTVHYSGISSYRIFAVSDHSYSRRKIASIPVMEPGYIHSFGLTQRYVVLVEFPIKFNPIRLFIGRPRPLFKYYRWEPERGTRFFVVDRDSGKVVRRAETDGFFAFHHVNAFEDGDDVVVDLVVHERGPGAIWATKTDRMRESNSPASNEERLHRYRVSLSTGAVRGGRLSDASLELPRINYARNNTRDYRYVYGVGRATSESDFYDQVVKLDVEGGDTASWSDDGCYAGEPIFVARPGAAREDDGVLLSVVLDTNARRSFLLALDARTGDELARAQAPHHIPFGFHGDYFS